MNKNLSYDKIEALFCNKCSHTSYSYKYKINTDNIYYCTLINKNIQTLIDNKIYATLDFLLK